MLRNITLAAAVAMSLAGAAVATGQVVERSYRSASEVTAAPAGGSGYLGVQIEDGFVNNSSESEPSRFHWGARVASVVPDSPAAKAGLKEGDLIMRVNEKDIRRATDLTTAIAAQAAEARVGLVVLRNGKEETLSAQLAKRPEPGSQMAPPPAGAFAAPPGAIPLPPMAGRDPFAQMESNFQRMQDQMDRMQSEFGMLRGGQSPGAGFTGFAMSQTTLTMSSDSRTGLSLQSLTPQLGEFFGAKEGEGVLITAVEPDSPAALAGLKAGDVIVSVGADTVDEPAAAQALAAEGAAGGVDLGILREKESKTIKMGPTAGPS